jgi:hypothetical protein
VLKTLSFYTYLSQLIVSLKKHTYFLLAFTAHKTPTFTGWLQQLCCRSCTRLWHSSLLSQTFLFSKHSALKSPVVLSLPYSPNYELFVCWEIFHHEIYVEIFADTFQQIRISHRCYTEIHAALKHHKQSRATLLTGNKWLTALTTTAYC